MKKKLIEKSLDLKRKKREKRTKKQIRSEEAEVQEHWSNFSWSKTNI